MHLRFAFSIVAPLCLLSFAIAAEPTVPAIMHLEDDGHVVGALQGSEDTAVWRWRSPLFAQPLEFPLSAVRGIHYSVPAVAPQPTGEYCFELHGDDVVFGDLAAVSDSEVTITSTPVGTLILRREQVRRIFRWKGNGSTYFGPNGLVGWTSPESTQWREEGGHLVGDKNCGVLFGNIGIPDKALIEVGLSWKSKADFVLALGTADRDSAVRNAFRFEVWNGNLVIVGESNLDADLIVVQPAPDGPGQVRVQLYLDQIEGRLTLLSPTGKPVATLAIEGKRPPPQRGVRLTNLKGDIRLEYLRVAGGKAPPPNDVRDEQPRVSQTDGSIVYGKLSSYDAKAKQFIVKDGDRETIIPHEKLAEIYTGPQQKGIPAENGAGSGLASSPARGLSPQRGCDAYRRRPNHSHLSRR